MTFGALFKYIDFVAVCERHISGLRHDLGHGEQTGIKNYFFPGYGTRRGMSVKCYKT